jgi:hypothetical protein
MRAAIGPMVLFFVAAAGLAGCAEERGAPSADGRGISYRLEGGDLSDTDRRANAYCERQGLRPRLKGVSGSQGLRVAIYDCI